MAKSMSLGTTLQVNKQVVGGLTRIGGIELTAETKDVTDLSSTSGYREFLSGFRDGGEVSCAGFLESDDVGQTGLLELLNAGTVTDCVIKFPDAIGKSWTFKAVVTKFATSAELEDGITFEMSLKVSGKPELGPSAA